MKSNFIFVITGVLVVGATFLLSVPKPGNARPTHPMHGQLARDVELLYGEGKGLPVDWSLGDITFTSARIPASELTEEEKYILAGSRSEGSGGLLPWSAKIFALANLYYKEYHKLPVQLKPAVIRTIPGMEQASEDSLSSYLNPLTDEWPRLQAREHSPGDVYLRRLTRDEMQHFARKTVTYQNIWFAHKDYDARTNSFRPIELMSDVYYMRIYGKRGILLEQFQYVYKFLDEASALDN